MALKDNLPYDTFYKLYITDNLTAEEIAEMYHTSKTSVGRLTREYNISKSMDLRKESQKRYFMLKYGVENPMQTDEYKAKCVQAKKTNNKPIKKHEYTEEEKLQIKEKMKKTCLERYGVENPGWTKESQEKIKKTNREKYGADNAMQNEKIKEKAKNACLEKYGVTSTALVPEIREKMNISHRKTLDSKEGQLSYLKNSYIGKNIPVEYFEILNSRENFKKWINETFPDSCTNYDIRQKIPFNESTIAKYIRKYNLYDEIIVHRSRSNYENEIIEYLKTIGIDNLSLNDRSVLSHYEIDIYCPEYKIAIEFNGDYWHSNLFADKKYHQEKSLLAEKNNIRLIHIYEHEWINYKDKIKSLLQIAFGKCSNVIYARNCVIKEITNKEAKSFNDANHLQNHRNAQITYGLFYHDKLVQLMSFSKHKKYEWEIIRGCPGSNNVVVGGVSKLFKHFVKNYDPKTVFSYCDYNKFDGHGYELIGMKYIGLTAPDLKYIDGKNVINRNPKQYAKHKQLLQLFGAGSKKYLWKKAEE